MYYHIDKCIPIVHLSFYHNLQNGRLLVVLFRIKRRQQRQADRKRPPVEGSVIGAMKASVHSFILSVGS